MKRFSIVALLLVLGISLWGYKAYQKSLLGQEDAEIWSNIEASTAASEKWNADTNATPAKLPAMRELAIQRWPSSRRGASPHYSSSRRLVQKDSTCPG